MENENKNKPQGNGKGKPHKHRSYFISPTDPQKQNSQAQSAEKNSAPQKNDKPNNNNMNNINSNNNAVNGNSQNKSKKHRHKNRSHENPTQPQSTASQKPTPTETAQTEQAHASQAKAPQKQNKNRHRHNGNNPHNNNNSNNASIKKTNEFPEVSLKNESFKTDSQKGNEKIELDFPKGDRLEKPAPKKLEAFSSSPEYEKYKDYQEFTYEELYGTESDENTSEPTEKADGTEEETTSTVEVVGIRFKASGKTYYFEPNGLTLHAGNHAIVETSRGLEFGEVVMGNSEVSDKEIVPPLRPVVRVATNEDIKRNAEIKKNEETAFKVCNEKIIAHELDMKLIDAQYTFDNTKLLFYFTSSGRVDFRELVKDLASVFRTRIELRQIGIRDEAKMIGGLGMCGRPLCCSIFLTDFGQVSIKMAKEQNLSLNSSKISGICGRLMCCLRYEHESYEYEIKRTPPIDTVVRTVDGVGIITETSPLQGTIKVRLVSAPDSPPKTYKREEVSILKKKN